MDEYENQLLLFQSALRQKFGDFALIDLSTLWNETKEKMYRSFLQKESKIDSEHALRIKSGTSNKKLFILGNKCEGCSKVSLKVKDQPYMAKFNSCFSCYISYINGREDRWNEGWRPNHGKR